MERPDIGSATEEVKEYILSLERQVNGATMLSKEISLLKAGIAHDMELIRLDQQGENYEHLKYVCLDKLSPKYNLVKVLMTNINSIGADTAKASTTKRDAGEKETLPIAGDLEPEVTAPVGNVFEITSRKIAQKHNAAG